MRVLRPLLAIVVLTSALGMLAPVAAADDEPIRVRPVITWSTDDRFGIDSDGDGRIDMPNTMEYVHNRRSPCPGSCPPPLLAVHLEAGLSGANSSALGELPILTYRWIVSGEDLGATLSYVRTAPHLDVSLGEGDYTVEMRLLIRLPWGTLTSRTVAGITVEDLLVVAIGDSYASGEGNPELRRDASRSALWAQGASADADASSAAAHRSTVAWPARAALALESRDRHSSVTFISAAATGARIDAGILAPQTAELPRAQLDAVRALVGERTIDVLLVQVGGNDIGFSRVVRGLVEADPLFDPICYEREIANVFDAVHDGDWTRGVAVTFDLPFDWGCRVAPTDGPQYPGLNGLPAAFDRVAAALDSLDISRVLLVAYPDPTGSDSTGTTCREIVGDATPPFGFHEIDESEQEAAVSRVLEPLNRTLARSALDHGWGFVGGIAEAFAAGHGYCAPWPDYGYPADATDAELLRGPLAFPDAWYRNPGRYSGAVLVGGSEVTWYRTAEQSAALQGPAAPHATSGTLHPNEIGHAFIAFRVLQALLGD